MATYKRYKKLQKFIFGQPVLPIEFKKGDLITTGEWDDLFNCENDFQWIVVEGEYICQETTIPNQYKQYEKLQAYYKSGEPVIPELFKIGRLLGMWETHEECEGGKALYKWVKLNGLYICEPTGTTNEYDRYEKYQRYYIDTNMPVTPEVFKKGDLINTGNYSSLIECQEDKEWVLVPNEYICEFDDKNKIYNQYEKLQAYYKSGIPVIPSEFIKGKILDTWETHEECEGGKALYEWRLVKDAYVCELNPSTNNIYTRYEKYQKYVITTGYPVLPDVFRKGKELTTGCTEGECNGEPRISQYTLYAVIDEEDIEDDVYVAKSYDCGKTFGETKLDRRYVLSFLGNTKGEKYTITDSYLQSTGKYIYGDGAFIQFNGEWYWFCYRNVNDQINVCEICLHKISYDAYGNIHYSMTNRITNLNHNIIPLTNLSIRIIPLVVDETQKIISFGYDRYYTTVNFSNDTVNSITKNIQIPIKSGSIMFMNRFSANKDIVVLWSDENKEIYKSEGEYPMLLWYMGAYYSSETFEVIDQFHTVMEWEHQIKSVTCSELNLDLTKKRIYMFVDKEGNGDNYNLRTFNLETYDIGDAMDTGGMYLGGQGDKIYTLPKPTNRMIIYTLDSHGFVVEREDGWSAKHTRENLYVTYGKVYNIGLFGSGITAGRLFPFSSKTNDIIFNNKVFRRSDDIDYPLLCTPNTVLPDYIDKEECISVLSYSIEPIVNSFNAIDVKQENYAGEDEIGNNEAQYIHYLRIPEEYRSITLNEYENILNELLNSYPILYIGMYSIRVPKIENGYPIRMHDTHYKFSFAIFDGISRNYLGDSKYITSLDFRNCRFDISNFKYGMAGFPNLNEIHIDKTIKSVASFFTKKFHEDVYNKIGTLYVYNNADVSELVKYLPGSWRVIKK